MMIEPDPAAAPRSRIHGEARAIAIEREVALDSLRAGDRLALGAGVSARVLHPRRGSHVAGGEANGNERSIALEIEAERFRLLMAGDLGAAAESRLADLSLAHGTMLKVAHHGSRGSTPESMLAALEPPVALISVGERNRYGHPHPDVLARLSRAGAHVMRTDERGALSFETDGVRAVVRGHIPGPSHALVYDAGGKPRRVGALARTVCSAPPPRMH
jgi:competence protein ComEC